MARKAVNFAGSRLGARRIDITDPYVEWLTAVNVGWQNPGNRYCIDYAIRNLPSVAPIVEIGSFCGLSTNLITHYKRAHGHRNTLFNCDRWEVEGRHDGGTMGDSPIPLNELREFILGSFIRNVRMFARDDLPHSIELWSDEFFAAWSAGDTLTDLFGREVRLGGPISFAYIDGDHDYGPAKRDFEACDRFLEPGGFILFDDSSDAANWGSSRVAKEAAESAGYELIIKNPNYLIRKR